MKLTGVRRRTMTAGLVATPLAIIPLDRDTVLDVYCAFEFGLLPIVSVSLTIGDQIHETEFGG